MLIPGEIINLDERSEQLLQTELDGIITDLELEYTPYFDKIHHWWDWYEAKPKSPVKDYPFKNASNVVIPLIQIMSDALQARALASIFGAGDRVWAIKTENEDPIHSQKIVPNVARHINWQARGNVFDFFINIYDWLSELYPIGESVMALHYRIDQRPVFFGPATNNRSKLQHQMVVFNQGPIFETAPREAYLWDTDFPIHQAPVVVREHEYNWEELKTMSQQDKAWRKPVIEKLKGQGKAAYGPGPSAAVRRKKDALDSRERFVGSQRNEVFDVREVWIDWPIIGRYLKLDVPGQSDINAPNLPLHIYYERDTRQVLRVTAQPYHLPDKPFYGGHFRKRPGRGRSVGVAKRLEQLQSLVTTLYNQGVDAVTRANSIWAKTSSMKHLTEPFDPRHPVKVSDMNEFQEMNLQRSVQPEIALITGANTYAERSIGVNDPAVGRETRHGGHPSPATSTLALLEQTGIMGQSTLSMLRHEISRAGRDVAILNQQYGFGDHRRTAAVFGISDAKALEVFMSSPIPSNYQFEVVAMSDSLNPETEMNRAIKVAQINQLYWGAVMQAVQVLESNKSGPILKRVLVQSIQSTTNVYARFLDAANVDDMEAFIVQLNRLGTDNAAAIRQFAGGARELAGGNSGVPTGGPLGGVPGGLPAGGNGSFAGLGAYTGQ